MASAKPPPPSKPPASIHPTAVIAEKAVLSGTNRVTIGENVVLHPYARVRAENGVVAIGDNCIIYERATVGCETTSATGAKGGSDVSIGAGCVIESNAVVEGQIGECSELGVAACVGKGAKVGRYCKIAAMERVEAGEELEDFTVVFADGRRRVSRTMRDHESVREAKHKGQMMAVELMRKMIPNSAVKWTM
ncbi:hypothetical protein B0A50_00099 [Salinomyces thailandicus]|uniref:Dynactin subunit 6 n=1 Tax=Salinomyces thailandicus TaxID=706561 RepID=A0A4V5N6V6_9PEZI|nr:hypothetical protein B0A50_00099 [Salinomyces thailandica]